MADSDKTQLIGSSRPRQSVPDAVLVCLTPDSVKAGAAVIELVGQPVLLGRGGDSDAVVDAPGIAEEHARFTPQAGAWAVEVVAGADPVTVNRSSVTRAFLKPGDTIGVGEARYAFRAPGDTSVDEADEADEDDEARTEFNSALATDAAAAGKAGSAEPAAPAEKDAPQAPAQEAAPRGRWPLLVAAVVVLAAIAAAAVFGLRS